VGPRASLDRCEKSRTHQNLNPVVQPVASRYTDYATQPTQYLTLRLLMSYIYGAPILDVSRSQ